jgi:lipase chaperone LimK
MPAALDGSSPPPLPVDGAGQLARTRAVRDFFDYFLSAQNQVDAATLDAIVRRAITAQLGGKPAAGEAWALWQQYRGYLQSLGELQHPAGGDAGGRPDFDAIELALGQRAALAARSMSPWNEVFFGDELHQQRTDLARLRIATDRRLSDDDKAARLSALEAALPPAQRAARERARQQEAAIEAIAKMQQQGMAPAAMRAQLTQTQGSEAAARVMQMQEAEQAWQARYADYLAQRAQIERLGLAPEGLDAQLRQLRQRLFPDPGEALRAEALSR